MNSILSISQLLSLATNQTNQITRFSAQLVIDNPMACQLNAASVYCNYKFADTYPQFILDQAKNFNNFKPNIINKMSS